MLSKYEVLVFTPPGSCVQCTAVKRKLDKATVIYEEHPLFSNVMELTEKAVEHYKQAKAQGYSSTPLVVVNDRETGERALLFAGNNPIKVKGLIDLVQ